MTVDLDEVPDDDFAEGNDLTPKQLAFGLEYLVDLNATQAAVRAGYSPNGADVAGSRLLRNRKVAAFIAERQQVAFQAAGVTAEQVVAMLVDSRTRATIDRQHTAAVRSAELLGKRAGIAMFAENINVSRFDAIDDEALVRRIANGNPELESRLLAMLRGGDPVALPRAQSKKD